MTDGISMKRSKAAASKAADVAQVGLRRNGAPAFAASSKTSPDKGGMKRGGSPAFANYSKKSPDKGGMKRAGENSVPSLPHPGHVMGGAPARANFARGDQHWNGPDGQRGNYGCDGINQ